MTDTKEVDFYHGHEPWKGFGTRLDHPSTSAVAMSQAGIDWSVDLRRMSLEDGTPVSGYRALVRTDRMDTLSVVRRDWKLIQNGEAAAWCDSLVGSRKAVYESAGSLRGGRLVWLLVRIPENIWVTKEDAVGKYILVVNPHVYGKSLLAIQTPLRFSCENALQAAIKAAGSNRIAIRHTGNIQEKLEEGRRVFGLSLKYYDAWSDEAQALARKSVGRRVLGRYFRELIPNPPKGHNPARARATRKTLHRLFEAGKGNELPTVRGTLWAAVNAVSEFVDHERTTRTRGGENENLKRFDSALLGSGAELKRRAWKEALNLLG